MSYQLYCLLRAAGRTANREKIPPIEPDDFDLDDLQPDGHLRHLLKCVLVLDTYASYGAREFRIGRFSDTQQIRVGLCTTSDPKDKRSPLVLRTDMALKCFGASRVYGTRGEAVLDAERLFPDNCGVKVIHMCCQFPTN